MARRFGWIAAGFLGAFAAAAFAVQARYWFIDPKDVDASSGMYAAGDLIGFVLIAGTLSLVPGFFLVRLMVERYSRLLVRLLFAMSVTGPICWLLFLNAADRSTTAHLPQLVNELYGLSLVLVIGPRIVASPIAFLIVAIALFFVRERKSRLLLSCGLVLEGVPLLLLALHFARAFSPG
jgi:hypothetical protein